MYIVFFTHQCRFMYCGSCSLIKYCDFPVFATLAFVGPTRCVVLMSADLIREAFIVKAHDFNGRLPFPSGRTLHVKLHVYFMQGF